MKLFRTLSAQSKDYLLVFLLGLSLLVTTYYIVIPQAKKLVDDIRLLQENKVDLAKLTMKRNKLETVSTDYTSKYLPDAEIALPQEKDAASILIALENLSASSQITIEQINLTPGLVSTATATAASPPPVVNTTANRFGSQSLLVEVKTRGSIIQFLEFINQLTNMRRLIDIGNMEIVFAPGVDDFVMADLLLHTYFLPPVTEIGAIESELPQITPGEEKVLSQLADIPIKSATLAQEVEIGSGLIGKSNLFQP